MSCSSLLQALDVRECVCVYGANVLSLVQSVRPLGERVVSAVEASRSSGELLMTLPCPSAQTVSKYNSQFHKLFQCVPKDELLMKGEAGRTPHSQSHSQSQSQSQFHSHSHSLQGFLMPLASLLPVYSCALLRDILLQGRLYISRNWLCFYANLFGKDIKVGM